MRYTLTALLLSITIASGAFAQGNEATRKSADGTKKTSSKARPAGLSAEETDVALVFARTHHAELAELLEQLRDSSPAEFKRGIREVHRTVHRLERLQEKQPSRYANELQRWKITSRLQLVAARWAMSQDPELEKTMRDLVRQRHEVHVRSMKEERARIAKRLKKLDSQISETSEGMDDFVTKTLGNIKKQVMFNETLTGQPRKNRKTDN